MIVSSDNLVCLPSGWSCLKIKDAVEKIPLTGKKIRQREYQDTGKIPVVDQGQQYIGGYTDNEDLRIKCDSPMVVFGDHTKVFKYVSFDFVAGADGIKVMRPCEVFFPKLFFYFLQAVQLPDKGYARHFQFLEKSIVPLPPLPEQKRIVAKIEELFTKLDAGVEALKKVRQGLKRYRQAVLKHAFEGKLTAGWREKNKYKLEPASRLLKRIAKEREKNILASSRRKGKAKKLPPLDKSKLPELPDGWEWTNVEHLNPPTRPCSYGVLKPGPNVDGGVPFVRVGDINRGRISTQGMKRIAPEIAAKYGRTKLKGREVLITLVGAIGRTAVVPSTLVGANTARAVGVIPLPSELNPSWIEMWFRNPEKVNEMNSKAHEVARKTLNLEDVRAATVAIPSVAEQDKIVGEVERHYSIADEIEQAIEKSLKQSDRLRQSILKRAFEGKLAPQDPEDEPAEKLLERIKAEKAETVSQRNG